MTLTSTARQLRKQQTEAEALLWRKVRDRQLDGYKFYRQYPIPPSYADFICRTQKLIIELDGAQHSEDRNIIHDKKRTDYLEKKGYRVIRFWNDEIYKNMDGVLETILNHLSLTHSANGACAPSSVALSLKGEGR